MTIIVHIVKIDSFLLWSETYIFSDGESNSYSLQNRSFAEPITSSDEISEEPAADSSGLKIKPKTRKPSPACGWVELNTATETLITISYFTHGLILG